MNAKRIGLIGGGALGLAALSGYGVYRFIKMRRSKELTGVKEDECREADIAL